MKHSKEEWVKRSRLSPSGRVSTMHRGRLPLEVLEEMEAGAKMTITEWARGKDISYSAMSGVFCQLRKWGHNYHPFQGRTLVKGAWKRGIVVDVTKDPEWFRSGISTYQANYANPAMVGAFRIIRGAIENSTEIPYDEIQGYLDDIQTSLIENRKKTLAAKRKMHA